MIGQASPTVYQFLYMTLAVDITDSRGLIIFSNEVKCVVGYYQRGNAVFAIQFTLYGCFTNKIECFSLTVVCYAACKAYWPIVL